MPRTKFNLDKSGSFDAQFAFWDALMKAKCKTFALLFFAASMLPTTVFAVDAVSLNSASVETYFSPNGGAGKAAVTLIEGARRRVWLAGYSFTSTPIAQALRLAKERGVEVRVVLDKSNNTEHYSGATYLKNAGVDVVIDSRYPIMHHKFIVADDDVAFGSMNFTKAGDRRNAENFNVFHAAPALTQRYASAFEKLYRESEPYVWRTKPAKHGIQRSHSLP